MFIHFSVPWKFVAQILWISRTSCRKFVKCNAVSHEVRLTFLIVPFLLEFATTSVFIRDFSFIFITTQMNHTRTHNLIRHAHKREMSYDFLMWIYCIYAHIYATLRHTRFYDTRPRDLHFIKLLSLCKRKCTQKETHFATSWIEWFTKSRKLTSLIFWCVNMYVLYNFSFDNLTMTMTMWKSRVKLLAFSFIQSKYRLKVCTSI